MSRRVKLLALLAVLAGVLVAIPQLAPGSKDTSVTEARAKKVHKVTQTFRSRAISTSADYPAVGSKVVLAGVVNGTNGRGAKKEVVTITGYPSPDSFTMRGKVETFLRHGSIRGKFNLAGSLLPDGSVTSTLKGRTTGGTERYEGARGRFTGEATAPSLGEAATGTAKGRLVY